MTLGRILYLGSAALAAGFFLSCASKAPAPVHDAFSATDHPLSSEETPPPIRNESVVGPCPGPEYGWVDGYWTRSEGSWRWVRGQWAKKPRPEALWIPGHWGHTPQGHQWTAGYWE